MPDWTYQTVFRPLLFRMQPRAAQRMAIGSLGRLGSFWLGRRVINFMGHMVPDRDLAFELRGHKFVSRVGLGCGLDSDGVAVGGLNQFGFAFLEYGPLDSAAHADAAVEFDAEQGEIQLTAPESNPGMDWLEKLCESDDRDCMTPVLVRFSSPATLEVIQSAIERSVERVAGYVIPTTHWETVTNWIKSQDYESPPLLFLLVGSHDSPTDVANLEILTGVRIDGSLNEGNDHRNMSQSRLPATISAVAAWRAHFDENDDDAEKLIVAGGGVHEPVDSYRLVEAGADIVIVDSGMVIAGPGLAKRCNELLAQTAFRKSPAEDNADDRAARQSWFWSLLMGVSMFGGGLLALIIAMTRVVLPYDESVVGMTREQLMQVNDRLLDFMAHDRVTLAGSMLSVGVLYAGLSWFGNRLGAHWAQMSIVVSAFVGFFSFFLFLGFGYFDSFHAFVTTILFQFLLLTLYARLTRRRPPVRLDLVNDDAWRAAQWGQLLYVIQGAVLVVAGTIICKIGITQVFIKEDLEFLCTTPDKIISANPQLLSLVAHDRATFGGMLISTGITVLLASMWGFRRGHAWLWWTLLISGCLGYVCAIYIHLHVGYTSFKHLAPAYGGLIWLCVASAWCYRFLHYRVADCSSLVLHRERSE
ncbi:MAG: hypothetical protein AAF497_07010 [Planctomycetota bacterium]